MIKLVEIDYDQTDRHVSSEIQNILTSFKDGKTAKELARSKINDILLSLETEIKLSDLTDRQLARFIPLLLAIKHVIASLDP